MMATVDPEACTGCELCVDACPEVFEMDDDGIATVKLRPVPPEVQASCREAVEGCPSEAIAIEED